MAAEKRQQARYLLVVVAGLLATAVPGQVPKRQQIPFPNMQQTPWDLVASVRHFNSRQREGEPYSLVRALRRFNERTKEQENITNPSQRTQYARQTAKEVAALKGKTLEGVAAVLEKEWRPVNPFNGERQRCLVCVFDLGSHPYSRDMQIPGVVKNVEDPYVKTLQDGSIVLVRAVCDGATLRTFADCEIRPFVPRKMKPRGERK